MGWPLSQRDMRHKLDFGPGGETGAEHRPQDSRQRRRRYVGAQVMRERAERVAALSGETLDAFEALFKRVDGTLAG